MMERMCKLRCMHFNNCKINGYFEVSMDHRWYMCNLSLFSFFLSLILSFCCVFFKIFYGLILSGQFDWNGATFGQLMLRISRYSWEKSDKSCEQTKENPFIGSQMVNRLSIFQWKTSEYAVWWFEHLNNFSTSQNSLNADKTVAHFRLSIAPVYSSTVTQHHHTSAPFRCDLFSICGASNNITRWRVNENPKSK